MTTDRNTMLRRLFAEAKKRGITPERLRTEIAPAHNKGRTLKECGPAEIGKLLRIIGADDDRRPSNGFEHRNYDALAGRNGMATPRQLRMIEARWVAVSHQKTYQEKISALNAFIKRICHIDAMQFVRSRDVQKLVKAIEQMEKKQLIPGESTNERHHNATRTAE